MTRATAPSGGAPLADPQDFSFVLGGPLFQLALTMMPLEELLKKLLGVLF